MSLFTIFWITTLHGTKFTFKFRKPKCLCCPLDSDPEDVLTFTQEIHNSGNTSNINDSTLYDVNTPKSEGDTPMDSSTMYEHPLHTPNHSHTLHRPLPLTPKHVEIVTANRQPKPWPLKKIMNSWFRRFVERHGLYGYKPNSNATLKSNTSHVLRAEGSSPPQSFISFLENPLSRSRDLFSSSIPRVLTSTASSKSTLAMSLRQLAHSVRRSSKETHGSTANHSLVVTDTEVTIWDKVTNRSVTYDVEQVIETRFGLICKARINGDHDATGALKQISDSIHQILHEISHCVKRQE
eukprot:57880_1